MSVFVFASFLLEYASIFAIEVPLLQFDIANYTTYQRSIHHLLTLSLWILYIGSILFYSYRKQHFVGQRFVSKKNWLCVMVCLLGCKIMTFIDWHTFKIIGELQGKDAFSFLTQYLYYFAEMGIVLLIIIYGQKAFETYQHKCSNVPYGGIVLALTWGIFHFVSRGVGLEIWNGISCVIFSILSGIMYVQLNRSYAYSFLIISIGYLL